MPVEQQGHQVLSEDAFLAFNKIGGRIQSRSLEILRKALDEKGSAVGSLQDVQDAYWEACQEILDPRRQP